MSVWIESHQRLRTEPKVYALAQELGVSFPHALGVLHLLWWLAIDNAEDGDVSNIPPLLLARELHGTDGTALLAALKKTGFVDEDGRIHNWMEYAGRLISDRMRKRAWRAEASAKRAARKFAPPVDPDAGKGEARAVAKMNYAVEFEKFWGLYPKKKAKPAAFKSFIRARENGAALDVILKAVVAQTRTEDWMKDGGKFIPNPTTWLNQERWGDELEVKTSTTAGDKGDLWAKKS